MGYWAAALRRQGKLRGAHEDDSGKDMGSILSIKAAANVWLRAYLPAKGGYSFAVNFLPVS